MNQAELKHDAAAQQIAFDALDDAGARARVERQDGAERAHGAGREIGRRQLGGKDRRIVGPALGALQAHQRLCQRIDAGTLGIGSRPAIARQVRLDQLAD